MKSLLKPKWIKIFIAYDLDKSKSNTADYRKAIKIFEKMRLYSLTPIKSLRLPHSTVFGEIPIYGDFQIKEFKEKIVRVFEKNDVHLSRLMGGVIKNWIVSKIH